MPVILKFEIPEGQCTAVWKITESLEELLKRTKLTDEEKATLANYKNELRKCEWVAVRTLLQELRPLGPVIKYQQNGRPYLTDNSEEISISHSGQYIAISLGPEKNIGVDIEHIHPKIKKIAERFVNEKEKAFIKEDTLVEQLCILWCAKEVLYKTHPEGMLSFKNNLLVSPFILAENGEMEGTIIKDNHKWIHKLAYKRLNDYMLVYTI
jgi:phosphopantetheinyl transferase